MHAHIQLKEDSRHARVLTCGAPERAARIAEFLQDAKPIAKNREYHSYLGKYEGQDILVISHGVGAAGAAICFQEVINAGAKIMVRLGTAGGLQDSSQIGDLVVATAAVRQEGLTPQMVPLNFPAVPDLSLTQELLTQTQASGGRFTSGIVVSSDLFYPGLLDGQLALYRDAGAVAVEMEFSALFVIGSLRKIKTAGIVALDGNPLKWNEGNYAPGSTVMKDAIERAIPVALKTLAAAKLD